MRFLQGMGRRAAVTVGVLALAAAMTPAAAVAAYPNGAFVVHEGYSELQARPVDNPCNGETVLVTGTFRFEITYLETPSGVQMSARTGVFQGTGVSDSGATYVVTNVGRDTVVYLPTTAEFSIAMNPTWHFVRTGRDGTREDFFMRVVLIVHVDETGTTTLDVEHVSTECR